MDCPLEPQVKHFVQRGRYTTKVSSSLLCSIRVGAVRVRGVPIRPVFGLSRRLQSSPLAERRERRCVFCEATSSFVAFKGKQRIPPVWGVPGRNTTHRELFLWRSMIQRVRLCFIWQMPFGGPVVDFPGSAQRWGWRGVPELEQKAGVDRTQGS